MKTKMISLLLVTVLTLTACESGPDQGSANNTSLEASQEESSSEERDKEKLMENTSNEVTEAETVLIQDVHGEVEVPINPKKVVVLDNRTAESLDDWGIQPVAISNVLPDTLSYMQNPDIVDIGNHKEPDLEAIAAVNPDLVIVGQRFASFYEDIKEIVPDAVVIDFSFDVSENAENPGENLVSGLKESNLSLGKIFQKEEEAQILCDEFDQLIAEVKEAYRPDETIMTLVVSGGNIGFSAPLSGRVWGPMYEFFNWTPALEVAEASSDHKGDDISVEAIAESNPDWILVLDRDAATSDSNGEENIAAKDVIEGSQALANTKAVQKGNVLYAPADTYTNESIQTYMELFTAMLDAFDE